MANPRKGPPNPIPKCKPQPKPISTSDALGVAIGVRCGDRVSALKAKQALVILCNEYSRLIDKSMPTRGVW